MSTTVTISGHEYTLRDPTLLETLQYKALADAFVGDDHMALWLTSFANLCADCKPGPATTVVERGHKVAEWLMGQHPEATVLDLYTLAREASGAYYTALSGPMSALLGGSAAHADLATEAGALGNGSAGPLKVQPSYQGSGELVSGSETGEPSSAP